MHGGCEGITSEEPHDSHTCEAEVLGDLGNTALPLTTCYVTKLVESTSTRRMAVFAADGRLGQALVSWMTHSLSLAKLFRGTPSSRFTSPERGLLTFSPSERSCLPSSSDFKTTTGEHIDYRQTSPNSTPPPRVPVSAGSPDPVLLSSSVYEFKLDIPHAGAHSSPMDPIPIAIFSNAA